MAYRFPNKEYLYLSKIPYLFYRSDEDSNSTVIKSDYPFIYQPNVIESVHIHYQ